MPRRDHASRNCADAGPDGDRAWRRAARRAFAQAGVGPTDIDVVELYDAFTINTILFLEDMGFCPKGEGGRFVEGGTIAPGGKLPVNTNGGGLSCVHPGMYGLFTMVEATQQIMDIAGERQVPDVQVGDRAGQRRRAVERGGARARQRRDALTRAITMNSSSNAAHRLSAIPRHWAERTPEAPALWERGRATSYGEFMRSILAGANLLRARGVREGDRVMIVAENCVAELVLFFATIESSAWPTIVNARMSRSRNRHHPRAL